MMSLLALSVAYGVSPIWSLLGAKRTCRQQANVVNDP